MKNVKVLDTTLREGEQTPGVSFSVAQKLEIARALDDAGVDAIEVGHPGVSKDIDEFIAAVTREDLAAELVVHSRACDSDVEAALDTGIERVAIFLGSSKLHLEEKLGASMSRASEMVYESVNKVTASGRKARFTAEDATRADFDSVMELCQVALEAGADRISLPDTVGISLPDDIRSLFRRAKTRLEGADLDVHCHNDLGLAVANTLAALEGGANCVHVTINGLGERTGITPLCNLAIALKILYGIDTVDPGALARLSEMVAEFSGIHISDNRPVVGANAFSHKSGVHTSGVLKNPDTYEPFSPELIKRERKIIVDKYTGRGAVKARLADLGIDVNEEKVGHIVAAIKSGKRTAGCTDEDLLDLVKSVWET